MLHYGKKKSILKFDNFWLPEFHNGSGTKNRFQQLWMYKIFKHRELPCIPCLGETHIKLQWYNIFPSLFFLFWFCNATFFHSGYVIKPPQPSSAFYRQPLKSGFLLTSHWSTQWRRVRTVWADIRSLFSPVCGVSNFKNKLLTGK